jgi:hypothetical protein
MIVTIATCCVQCHSQPVLTRIHKITIPTCPTHHTFFSCIQDTRHPVLIPHHLLTPSTAQLPTISTTLAVPAIARFATIPLLKSTMASFARLQPDRVPCQPFTLSMESFIPFKSRQQKTKLCLTVSAPLSTPLVLTSSHTLHKSYRQSCGG